MAKSKTTADAGKVPANMASITMLSIQELMNSPTNPRKTYRLPELEELARSIRDHGIINPITVRHIESFAYEVVAGNRRFRAAQIAGLGFVPCIIRDLTDDQVLDIQIDENLHRQDVPPLEEAEAFKSLLDARKLTVHELAGKVNKSPAYIYRRMKLANLSEKYRPHIEAGALPVTTAEIIASYPQEAQEAVYTQIHYKESNVAIFFDSKNVRTRLENQTCNSLKKAMWPLDRENLQPGLQACNNCERNTAVATLLFHDGADAPRCTDKSCWNIKKALWIALSIQEWKSYCKSTGTEELYADLYYYKYDQKPYEAALNGSEKILGQWDFEPAPEGTPGAMHVLFIGGSSWDEEQQKLNHTIGWVVDRVRSGHSGDWERDKIMNDKSLSDEQKTEAIEKLQKKRENERAEKEIENTKKELKLAISEKAIKGKPVIDIELIRLSLYYLTFKDSRIENYWHELFEAEAKDWRPDSFLKLIDKPEWNAQAVDEWLSILECAEGVENDPETAWDSITEEEQFEFMDAVYSSASYERLSQMLAIILLYRGHDRIDNWRQYIPLEPIVRYGKHIGLNTDEMLTSIVDERKKAHESGQLEEEDDFDFDDDNDDIAGDKKALLTMTDAAS